MKNSLKCCGSFRAELKNTIWPIFLFVFLSPLLFYGTLGLIKKFVHGPLALLTTLLVLVVGVCFAGYRMYRRGY